MRWGSASGQCTSRNVGLSLAHAGGILLADSSAITFTGYCCLGRRAVSGEPLQRARFLYGAGWNYAGRRCRRLALCGHERHAHGCGASFRCPLVTVSILFAMAFSFAGLWLAFYFRDEPRKAVWRKIGGAGVMGAAVSGMHYTGYGGGKLHAVQSSPKYV